MKRRANIHVTGIVQGVGFRPFVYRVAKSLSLEGYVLNLGDAGVSIVVEGNSKNIEELIHRIEQDPPSISRVDELDIEWEESGKPFKDFIIKKSSTSRSTGLAPDIPPDIAICSACITDMTNSNSRWYLYPFVSCAACGPRFSTITDLPYDRPNTTMVDFPLCNICNTGYTSPLDRRYHAQTTACGDCGPIYRLVDAHNRPVVDADSIAGAANLLSQGSIIAVQGIGGTHLVTKVTDAIPIQSLRTRKQRAYQPFAIMARNLDAVRAFSRPTPMEEGLLTSWRRPIVLVKKRNQINDRNQQSEGGSAIPDNSLELISPGLDTVGVMLPYSPLHHLLFHFSEEPALVMTSANPTGLPMYIHPDTILSNLEGVADYFLIHNRRIHQRADDSVIKPVSSEHAVFIRRARGYVPDPIRLEGSYGSSTIVAAGPEEKTTGAVLKSGRIYVTQHIGDTNRLENIEFLSDALNHMVHLLAVDQIDAVACDLHPEFLTTEFAEMLSSDKGIPLFRVQHHHAHLASLMVDHQLSSNTRITCITADGFGFGDDGCAWGGEVLVGGFEEYARIGGLKQTAYAGGDLSAKYAVRPFVGLLRKELSLRELLNVVEGSLIAPGISTTEESLSLLVEATKQKVNAIQSSSAGRYLDAVAIALGICSENTYDGECPMKLESLARKTKIRLEPRFNTNKRGMFLDIAESLKQLLDLKKDGSKPVELAYAAQWYLGESLAKIACDAAHNEKLDYVGFSGGVALNRIISKAIINHVTNEHLTPLIHRHIPPGDGGISSGQAVVAAAKLAR
ncbi:MAG: carbamoyltransferase HypF [Candidatus Thorarchaeota archaeon]|nr:carbamoyltransferase HypF [Candidatus Thorarchaeota archaeon]